MEKLTSEVELIRKHLTTYPDFPKRGILFRDIFGILSNAKASGALHSILTTHCKKYKGQVQAVCGIESRGFLFGPSLAFCLDVPFVAIRKKGKLPGAVTSIAYKLEYGSETIEIQTKALIPGTKVLLVDDLLATGGTLEAACKLIHSIGSTVDHCLVIVELNELNGRKKITCPVHSIMKV